MIVRLAILVVTCWQCFSIQVQAQEPIVLRDLTLIRGKSIERFDEFGVLLSDSTLLSWDKILKARVSPDQQAEFNEKISRIGLPVFRLKARIAAGDWSGAGEIAEPLFDSMLAKTSNPDQQTAFLISLATMKSASQKGRRAKAVAAFLRATTLQKEANQETLDLVKNDRLADVELETQLSNSLIPVWFNVESLPNSLDPVFNEIDQRPGAMIYLASMRIEVGQFEAAKQILTRLSNFEGDQVQNWLVILQARIKQKEGDTVGSSGILKRFEDRFIGPTKPVANFYSSLDCLHDAHSSDNSEATDNDRSRSILSLLSIPALYSNKHPHLSAAALFHSAEIARLRNRPEEAQKLREELLKQYPQTYHGGLQLDRNAPEKM